MTAALAWPAGRAGAETFVADLKALDPSIDAGIVPGLPSCLSPCQHDDCRQPAAAYLATNDPLHGERVWFEGCYRHTYAMARFWLEDADRLRHQEPPHIDVEVLVIPERAA